MDLKCTLWKAFAAFAICVMERVSMELIVWLICCFIVGLISFKITLFNRLVHRVVQSYIVVIMYSI